MALENRISPSLAERLAACERALPPVGPAKVNESKGKAGRPIKQTCDPVRLHINAQQRAAYKRRQGELTVKELMSGTDPKLILLHGAVVPELAKTLHDAAEGRRLGQKVDRLVQDGKHKGHF